MITKDTKLDMLLEYAIEVVDQDLNSGEIFTVRDLFRGFEWKRLAVGPRIKLGSMFYAWAQSDDGSSIVEIKEKNKQNQQQYQKA